MPRREHRHRERQLARPGEQPAPQRRQQPGQDVLGAEDVGTEHDRRAQEIERELGVDPRLGLEQRLELRLLPRVEQPGSRPGRPVLVDRRRGVGVEPVGRHGRRVDEPLHAGGRRGPEHVERAVDVDRPGHLPRGVAGDQERQVDDDVGAGEGRPQRLGVADVALPVLHLRPAALGRVERTAGDADDPLDPVVVLEERDQAGAERAGRTGDGDGQPALGPRPRGPSPSAPARTAPPGRTHREAAAEVFFFGAPSPAWPG